MTDQTFIYPERDNKENLLDNQVQNQNQSYIHPVNINTQSQKNSTPYQAYDSTELINKSQNQISQALNYTPQEINDPMIQSLFPPSQNCAFSAQEGISLDNNIAQTQTPGNTNFIIQSTTPVYQTQYEKYKNITEIPHKGIYEIDEDTFFISDGCCYLAFPSLFIIIGIGEIFMCFYLFFINKMNYQIFIFVLIHAMGFILIGICYIHCTYSAVYFIKGSNSLTVIKKSLINKEKKMIYRAGELEKVEFDYNNDCKKCVVIQLANGKKDIIFQLECSCCTFTKEEVEYFLYHINSHIYNKMRG
jgi:hypothetical protein